MFDTAVILSLISAGITAVITALVLYAGNLKRKYRRYKLRKKGFMR